MLLDIIFFICMYPVNFILYFVYKSFGKMENMRKKGIYYGLHAPKEEELREAFLALAEEQEALFLRRMRWCLLATFWIPFVNLLIPSVSIDFTIWMLWFVGFLGLLMVPYLCAHKVLRAWKREHVVVVSEEQRSSYTELHEVGKVRRVRPVLFLIPVAVSAAAAVSYTIGSRDSYAGAFSYLIILFAIITILFYLLALWMDQQKVLVISEDSNVNLNFARAKKNHWKNFWLFCAWCNTLLTVGFALLLGKTEVAVGSTVLVGGILYTMVLLAAALCTLKKLRALEEEYREKRTEELTPDDDEHWLWGIIYYNKQDKHSMVEARVGIGTAMNLATPIGKIMNLLAAVAILSIPIFCLWMILEEFTPIQLMIEDKVLVAEHLDKDYEIPVGDITELELITERPKMSKNSGTAMDTLYKGNFHITYGSDCEVFLNPQNDYFITFVAEDTLYYMSAAEDAGTLTLYESLQKIVENQ